MYDFHPLLTSFPIVLISLAVLSDIIFYFTQRTIWLQFNYFVLLLGMLFSLLAFFSGLIASSNASELSSNLPEQQIAYHYSIAKLILFAYIPLILFRYLRFERKIFGLAYYFFCLLQFTLIAYTGHLGGDLVFKHGIGIQTDAITNISE